MLILRRRYIRRLIFFRYAVYEPIFRHALRRHFLLLLRHTRADMRVDSAMSTRR